MAKNKSMAYQVKRELYSQLRFGESKYESKLKEDTNSPEGIFSKSTMDSYIKHSTAFANWTKATYGCKTLIDAYGHIQDYIDWRVSKGLSAWTVKLDASAIAKLYQVPAKDLGIKTPPRYRADITRSRKACEHDKHFSEARNEKAVLFGKGTGLRRSEIKALLKEDVYCRNGKTFVHVEKGKGGKTREVEVASGFEAHVLKCAAAAKKGEKIFAKDEIKNRMDEHSYRAEYAKTIYKQYERPLDSLSDKEKYYCRRDKKGCVYDRQAMLITSKNLGHNRINVIASNYLY